MKKEYLIGGVLGAVLCGIVAYAVITFIGMQNSERAQQLAHELPPAVPLAVTAPQPLPPAAVPLPEQAKGKKTASKPVLSDKQKPNEMQADALTGVKITLKNGRSVIADFCRDVRGKLLCIVAGGSMEIDRQEIESIRDVKLQSISSGVSADEPSDAKADDKKPADKVLSGAKGAQPKDGKMVGGLTVEQARQLDAINERKTLLLPERERLMSEREQLHSDVKNAGIMRSQEQFDTIKKRISDLETKINGFNEEVNKMNEEEQKLIDASSSIVK